MGHHLAGRLVIGQHARWRRRDARLDHFAVDAQLVTEGDALPDMRRLAVDGDAPFVHQLFHVAPRADAGLGQHLLQLGRIGLGRQHSLGRLLDCLLVHSLRRFDVVGTREHVGEDFAHLGLRQVPACFGVGRVAPHHRSRRCSRQERCRRATRRHRADRADDCDCARACRCVRELPTDIDRLLRRLARLLGEIGQSPATAPRPVGADEGDVVSGPASAGLATGWPLPPCRGRVASPPPVACAAARLRFSTGSTVAGGVGVSVSSELHALAA